jgi:hypothetical protein
MPISEKPVDPAEIDADGLAYEVVARLQKHGGVSVVTVGTKVTPPPLMIPTKITPTAGRDTEFRDAQAPCFHRADSPSQNLPFGGRPYLQHMMRCL